MISDFYVFNRVEDRRDCFTAYVVLLVATPSTHRDQLSPTVPGMGKVMVL